MLQHQAKISQELPAKQNKEHFQFDTSYFPNTDFNLNFNLNASSTSIVNDAIADPLLTSVVPFSDTDLQLAGTTNNLTNASAEYQDFHDSTTGYFQSDELYDFPQNYSVAAANPINSTIENVSNLQSPFESFNYKKYEEVSPQSSMSSSTLDLKSIFSNYDLNFEAEEFSRANSITSLSSTNSAMVLTKGELLPSTDSTLPSFTMAKPETQMTPDVSIINHGRTDDSSPTSSVSSQNMNKRHSDSRLSLNELSNFLHLPDVKETAKREQDILTIFKDELGFELGLKTWVRDTSASKRAQLIKDLTAIVEARYHYGYDEKMIEVIVRRASYYTMQGRLRRERRIEQKIKGDKFDKVNRRNERS